MQYLTVGEICAITKNIIKMRKLTLQMSITLDGFVANVNGGNDWLSVDNGLMQYVHSIAATADTLLMGRKMTEEFTTYWEKVVNEQPDSSDYALAKKLVDIPKIVFSKTVNHIAGKNVTIEHGDLADVVKKLKTTPGSDILVYGGAAFASSLIKEKLVDEFYFLINPILINKGLRIFELLEERQKLTLVNTTTFNCGVAALNYHVV
jgi:dihydrofolate reductase